MGFGRFECDSFLNCPTFAQGRAEGFERQESTLDSSGLDVALQSCDELIARESGDCFDLRPGDEFG
jgi:hypothetical protein